MGFWNEILRLYNQPSKWAGQGVFKAAKGLTGSDKFSAAGARMAAASTGALGDDPFPFRDTLQGSDLGMTQDKYNRGRQAGDWVGSLIGSLIIGGALGGGAAGAGEGGGAAGGGGASGLELEAASGTGQGAWAEPAAGGVNWQSLMKMMPKQGLGGGGGGGSVSLPYVIAQQAIEDANKQNAELLGTDADLPSFIARQQLRNYIRSGSGGG